MEWSGLERRGRVHELERKGSWIGEAGRGLERKGSWTGVGRRGAAWDGSWIGRARSGGDRMGRVHGLGRFLTSKP